MNYELDPSRPALILQEGNICLTKENLWSVGLQHYIERNVSFYSLGVWCWVLLQFIKICNHSNISRMFTNCKIIMKDNWMILMVIRYLQVVQHFTQLYSSQLPTGVYELVNENMICGDLDLIA